MGTKTVESKREREKALVSQMIAIYCKGKHHTRHGLCPRCQALEEYARQRSDKCPFMESKTFCSNCKVHCYRGEMREEIRRVMAYAGPRMLLHHPLVALSHALESFREKRRLERKS